MDWNISSRGHQCRNCGTAFVEGKPYHTLLTEEKAGFDRADWCPKCWGMQKADPGAVLSTHVISQWQGIYEAPPAAPPDPIQRETAETLLRKLLETGDEKHQAACFILAAMLERKRILKVKGQVRESGRRFFIYEQPRTGEVITIRDPELQLAQLEDVQRTVADLLEHGLPTSGQPTEEPFNPPSEVSTLAPA